MEIGKKLIAQSEKELRNFKWMISEVDRLRTEIADVPISISKYGKETTGGAKGSISDPVGQMAIRRSSQYKRMREMEEVVERVNQAVATFEGGEKERTILDCMLDGLNTRDIARHLRMSPAHTHRLTEKIIEKMAKLMFLQVQ